MTRLIDTMHLGHDRVIGAYEIGDAVIVDPARRPLGRRHCEVPVEFEGDEKFPAMRPGAVLEDKV